MCVLDVNQFHVLSCWANDVTSCKYIYSICLPVVCAENCNKPNQLNQPPFDYTNTTPHSLRTTREPVSAPYNVEHARCSSGSNSDSMLQSIRRTCPQRANSKWFVLHAQRTPHNDHHASCGAVCGLVYICSTRSPFAVAIVSSGLDARTNELLRCV